MPGTHRNQIQAVQDRRRKIDRDLYSTVPRGVDTDRLALHPSAQGGAAYHTVQHRRRKTDGQTVMPLTGLPSDAHYRRAVATYLSEDVTQGPVNLWPACSRSHHNVWWTEGREREVEQLGPYEERFRVERRSLL